MTKSLYRTPKSNAEIMKSPKGMIIDFSKIKSVKLSRNIEHCYLTGLVHKRHSIDSNIITSELFELIAKGVNWEGNDIKDSLIKKSRFSEANLNVSGIMNNIIIDTVYENCSFYNSTFTDTIFESTTFSNCNLTSLVIKRCTFKNCQFISCKTSNKLIEYCVLEDTSFLHTDFRLETILENFGNDGTSFDGGEILINEKKYSKTGANDEFERLLQDEISLTSLERFNLLFFLNSDFKKIGYALDEALRVETWLPLCRVPSTFNNLFSGFTSFLVNQYEANRLPISPLLRLYTLTTQFDKQSFPNQHMVDFRANWSSISMRLLPYFEDHLFLVDKIVQEDFPYAFLIVDGPADKDYFRKFFYDSIQLKDFQIRSIVPKNSPAEILLFFKDHYPYAALVSIFLSSRLKIEIERLRADRLTSADSRALMLESPTKKQGVKKALTSGKGKGSGHLLPHLFSLEIGKPAEIPSIYRLRLAALFPERIAFDLQIDLKLSLIYKLRNILIEILRRGK